MDELFQITFFMLELKNFVEEIDPAIKEILTKAMSHSWKELGLSRKFSDAAIQFVHESIIASGGIQRLYLKHLELSNESWVLLNSYRPGTGDKDSFLTFSPCGLNGIFSQVLVSGFKELYFEYATSQALRSLGQVLSMPDCELSEISIYLGVDSMNKILETVTTNWSVTDFFYHVDNTECNEKNFCHTMKNLYKFKELKNMRIWFGSDNFLSSFDCLLPLLEIATEVKNPCLEIFDIIVGYRYRNGLSDSDKTILLQVAKHYPKLRSFGSCIHLTLDIEYALCMNGKWRHIITRGLEIPLSLWRFVLEDVEKQHNPKSLKEQDENDNKEDEFDCKETEEENKKDNNEDTNEVNKEANDEVEDQENTEDTKADDESEDDEEIDKEGKEEQEAEHEEKNEYNDKEQDQELAQNREVENEKSKEDNLFSDKAAIVSNSIRYELIKSLVQNHATSFIEK